MTIIFVNDEQAPALWVFQFLKWLRANLLLTLTIAGVFIGGIIGFSIRPYQPSEEVIMFISFPGDVMMRMLKMIILPLIASSLIAGKSSRDRQIQMILIDSVNISTNYWLPPLRRCIELGQKVQITANRNIFNRVVIQKIAQIWTTWTKPGMDRQFEKIQKSETTQ